MPNRALAGLILVLFLFLSPPSRAAEEGTDATGTQFEADRIALGLLVAESRYDEAIAMGQALLENVRVERGPDSLEEAQILDGIVEALYRSGQAMEEETLELAARAVALKELHLGGDSPELAASLLHSGNLHIYRHENAGARADYERALQILEDAGERASPRYGIALNNLGVTWKRSGDYAKALEIYQRALALQEEIRGPDHFDVASSLNNIALVMVAMGDYDGAIECHRRALAIREAYYGPNNEWVAESLNNLATVLGYAGEFEEALAVQERAISTFATALGVEHERYGSARFNLAVLHNDMGDYGGALSIYVEVLADQESSYGPDNAALIEGLESQAGCRAKLGEYSVSEELYRRSLAICEREYGEGNPWTSYTLKGLGECLTDAGRYEEAEEALTKALAVQESAVDTDSPEICEFLHSLARLELLRGEFASAESLAERSVVILESSFDTDHPLLARALILSAQAAYALGDDRVAMQLALRAEAVSRRHLRATMGVLSEHLALDYGRTRTTGLDLAISMLSDSESGERVAAVWDQVIRSRALVLDEMAARGRSLAQLENEEYGELIARLQLARSRLAHLSLRGPGWEEPSAYRLMLAQANQEKEAAERELALANRQFREEEQRMGLGFEEVVAALAPEDELVAFVMHSRESGQARTIASGETDDSDRYGAFVLDGRESTPRYVDLGSADELDRLVTAWHEQAAYGSRTADPSDGTRGFMKRARDPGAQQEAYEKVARDLRRWVWDRLASDAGEPRRRYVVSEGSLHLLNFYALVQEDGSYLLESGPLIQLLPTERSLCTTNEPVAESLRLLVVGDPSYQIDAPYSEGSVQRGAELDCLSLEDLSFQPLTGARLEAEELLAFWQRTQDAASAPTLLVGAEATEEAIKEEARGYEVIHLATHGFLLPENCADGNEQSDHRSNPLLRSGLAFAGANEHTARVEGEEDGLLTAEEVAGLDLSSVEWAVLSACDTGLGEIRDQGEGVFGLSRSFQVAGARTVVMSLWAVDDAATRAWMRDLYAARFAQGMGTADAVRTASRQMLQRMRESGEGEHPYYWAGFIALGKVQ